MDEERIAELKWQYCCFTAFALFVVYCRQKCSKVNSLWSNSQMMPLHYLFSHVSSSKSLIFLLFLLSSWEGGTEWDWVPMWGISFNPCLLSTHQHVSGEFIPLELGGRSPPTRLWSLSPVPQGCCVSPIPHQSLPESCWKSNFCLKTFFFLPCS